MTKVCLKAALNSVNLTCSRSLSKQAIVFTNAIFGPSEMLSLMAPAIKMSRLLTWPPVTNFDSFSILAIASWAVDALKFNSFTMSSPLPILFTLKRQSIS